MALNLSTLTSSATSGDVLAEALTTADFLEPVPVLRNLARGSQKGGDAKQDVALNQPKALPLDANGKGYCYLPVTTGNAPAVTFPTIGASDDFVLEMVAYVVNSDNFHIVSGANSGIRFNVYFSHSTPHFYDGFSIIPLTQLSSGLSTLTIKRSSGLLEFKQNGVVKASQPNNTRIYGGFTHLSFNGQFTTSVSTLNGYIQTCTLSIGGTEELKIDFTATNVRHGDTKFKCATGQVVTINQAGNDPATVIKKSVLRFDGVNDGLQGLFANNINSGYMFAAFSVLGDGGDDYGRIFGANINGGFDYQNTGFALRRLVSTETLNLRYSGGWGETHQNLFDDDRGDLLFESRLAPSSQKSKVNDADGNNGVTTLPDTGVAATEYSISSDSTGGSNLAIDLEFLALFPASITDDQADSVRNYINNRNNVFSLIDSQGYYFFDPQIFPIVDPADFVSYWNGNIVGSDNTLNASVSQSTVNDQPTRDGYKVTFNDNADHLVVASPLSGGQAGWQIVGTSLGTFAYRVNANAVTELNLLGNLGNASYRKTGDLYGIILLPESASSADIEAAKKLLIDRGALESFTGSNLYSAWYQRGDIVEFKAVPMQEVTNIGYAFASKTALVSFPAMSFPALTYAVNAWQGNTSMSDFGAIQAPLCTNFTSTWQGTSALTSFPSGAKLGTEATNVNFSSAWRSSGLTSFSTPLPTATTILSAWRSSSITSFSADLPLAIDAREAWLGTPLTSFSTPLPLVTKADYSWFVCSSITNFSAPLPVVESVFQAWLSCTSLTDFSADVFANWNPSSITSGVFNLAWDGCSALSAQSVENILVSIDASGKYATTNGASGGSALADAGIDIDYNVATGSLSAATNSAVTSLKAKGWSIIVNNVTL
jgi:hypothetical protein